MNQLLSPLYLLFLTLLIYITKSAQLCNPYSASFPCSNCQSYAKPTAGLCNCLPGYYMDISTQPNQICDLCQGSCLTCYGPLSTNCISCQSGFTFQSATATCVQANSVTDQVIVQAYYIEGFTVLTGWAFSNFATSTYQCGLRTLLGGTVTSSTNSIQVTLNNLSKHFILRIKASFYFLNANGVTKLAMVKIGTNTNSSSGNETGYSFETCSNTAVTYVTRAIDLNVNHQGDTAVVYFYTNAAVHYGIRDVIIIAQKCASNCSSCTGYLSTQCVICTDLKRSASIVINGTNGTCYCKDQYYQQPFAGTCADPCPSVPIKYYGDNTTRTCVTRCPNNTFAFDDLMRCWADCPTTSSITTKKLYRDYVNWRCVTNCPSTQPYGDPVTRTCYSVCPSPRFGDNTTMTCVAVCPHTYLDSGPYKTYASGRICVPYCDSTSWANPATATCISPCTSVGFPLKDDSTGQNLCVASCPPPNRFASSGSCVQICPANQYGDITTWACTTTCTAPYWGLQSYNRKCVSFCPSNTWARTSSRTCVNTTAQCNPLYANDYSRACVIATSCPFGTYADSSTWRCLTYCPNGTYGHPITRVCQSNCASPYFSDPGVNLCVTSCLTTGLYADESSGRACVAACNNSTGTTPWADDSTRRCVADCNNTIDLYLADNTTWKCVFQCPLSHVADFTTLTPKCVTTCPSGWFADATAGAYKICVQKCSTNPPQFGDTFNGYNLCVNVCAPGTFGDQTGNRLCRATCPRPYYSQNDNLRRCVLVCNSTSYGYQQTCTYNAITCQYSYKRLCYQDPHSCPTDYFGDNSTQLCVNPCPSNLKTFGDPQSKFCVLQCPDYPGYTPGSNLPQTYYADKSNRKCVLRCSSSATPPLFGSNSTRTCQSVCLDFNAYAETQSPYRTCINRCFKLPVLYYANNFTKTCGNDMNCPLAYYGQNNTQLCVQYCPNNSWGFHNATIKLCMDICPANFKGDDSTSKRICVAVCPDIPDRYADLVLLICVDMCNLTFYGDPTTRNCIQLCPVPNYFSYQITRRCLTTCPFGYFADNTTNVRKCQSSSSLCTSGFGDSFLRACVSVCTGPTPVDTFGSGRDCVTFCPNGTYADSYSASRLCVTHCPPGNLNSIAAPNLYGDPITRRCVARCVTPFTWADRQTRLCQYTCSANPIPTYSQNFYMTCVTALNCPTTPTLTFGDNTTRSCVSFCSNNWWGDPTSRNCVSQCPNLTTTGTSNYYGDNSTGQYLCVVICPVVPRLFGENTTNMCVSQCPSLTFGDQTGNRTCVPQCPLINATIYYFAQNLSRICVQVCVNGTWGLKSTRQCVENPFDCGALWADSTTNLCVVTCPVAANLYGDPTTRRCVPLCPNGSYADSLTQTCVTQCPYNNGVYSTFGNNDTWICQPICTQPNAYADLQTNNRYCVTNCSQSPNRSFADPSTKFCVARCPTFPSLFGQIQNFTCVSACAAPYFSDTHTRLCVLNCDAATQFKLRDPRSCVTLCPSSPPLFGDSNTRFCETNCSVGYQYAVLRICIASCTNYSLFDFNNVCVKFCPYGYYAYTDGHCVSPCPLATLFGQNTTTTCRTACITGYAHNRLCIAICPDGLWGYNGVCQSSCPSGTAASNISNLCIGNCDSGTFNQSGICVANCTNSYADPNTRLCSSSCTLNRYADPSTNNCVNVCPVGYYNDPSYTCKTNCAPLRADNITRTCTSRCSNGTWGFNNKCVDNCPSLYYGYQVNRDCYNIPQIPDPNLFADNITQTWVSTCSINPLRFGDRVSRQCVVNCSSSTQYSDPVSRQCQTTCTIANYYRDPTTKKCVLICPVGYHANYLSRFCQINCTLGLFDYIPSHTCVSTCPLPYYGYINGTQKVCVIQCLPGTFAEGSLCKNGCTLPLVADPVTHRCVANCLNNKYASTDAFACVSAADCSTYNKIADSSTNRCVGQCPIDPDYYKQNGICVPYCAFDTYADPTAGVRQCKSLCTQGLYGDPVSGRCLSSCLPGYYAFNDTNLCVKTCPNGFADNQTGVCVAICSISTYADSLNNKCMYICSGSQFSQGNICVPTCSNSLYGNPITRKCQLSCPDFDYTFAQNNTRLCVKNCSNIPNSYADRSNNFCMENCTQANEYALDGFGICTSLCPEGLYMENSTKKCQPYCDTGYAQNTTRFCVARCFGNPQTFAHIGDRACVYRCKTDTQNLYADNQTNFCVSYNSCSRNLSSYSDPISGNCVLFCPEGLYSQNTTFTCTSVCITGYADNLTRNCVSQCPQSQQTYGMSNKCVKVCPDGWYAQNITQLCVRFDNCPSNTWSDIKSKHCVARCPSEPLTFGYDGTTSCVSRCPSTPDLYGDIVTQKCIWPCTNSNGQRRFADATSRTCVFVCPIQLGLYGDPTTGRCTSSCHSANPYKDNSTQRCVAVCPSNPDYYAHIPTSTCVRVCPTGLYASDPITRICTSTCQPWLTFKDPTTNRCVANCPLPYYVDNSTYNCVPGCPTNPDYYADSHSRDCVFVCPIGPFGADNQPLWRTWIQDINRTCVTRCPVGYFAQNSSGRCVSQCPPNQFADPIIQVCVADCTLRPNFYKETGSRTCVTVCPSTPTKAHRYEPTHTCVNMTGAVSGCIAPYFTNQITDRCTTLCPSSYYADVHTRFCRLNCTNGQFADPVDRKCKLGCTTNPTYFAYTGNMTCVQYCPAPFFSQNVTFTCTNSCPNTSLGVILYAYTVTRQCVVYCPSPYFAYIVNQTCLLGCPNSWYAFDQTRTCVQSCTPNYSADDSTNRCVQTCPSTPNYYSLNNICIPNCPNGTYKDNSTRTCVADCPFLPLTFADNSTNECVEDCPPSPNYFADNYTRVCVFNCSVGLFADPSTRACVQSCPPQLDTYAQPISRVCQPSCFSPYYASDLTKQCVPLCPNLPVKTYAQDNGRFCTTHCIDELFGNNDTRKCQPNCLSLNDSFADSTSNLCVTTCPIGFFAYNLTAQCRRDCPGLFADRTTRKCVLECPGTQRLFADSTTGTCVSICPSGYYGDTDTWTCLTSCQNVTSGYILQVQRLCVAQCPSPYFALVSQRLCVQNCGTGLYGDQVTRQCNICPTTCTTCLGISACLSCTANLFLQFGYCVSSCTINLDIANYANNQSMTCGPALNCPSFTFGLNSSKLCQVGCPTQMYGNSQTKTCQNCPSTCLTCISLTNCSSCTNLAQYSEQDSMCYAHCSPTLQYKFNVQCYSNCPDGSFADYTNVTCLACNAICLTCVGNSLNCTSCDGTFKFNGSCVTQCPNGYYGNSSQCNQCRDQIDSCSKPLSFTTTTVVQNYQQVIILKFNQNAIIKSDPTKFINVNLKMSRRRLQNVSNLINNGVGFTAQVLPDGTIKLYLNPGVSLDNVQYSVSINDPTQITTASGATLQNLQQAIQLMRAQVYTQSETVNAPLVVAGKILSIIMLVFTFAMLVFGLMPFYLAIQAFQMMSLFAYSKQLAPNLYYFLKQMRLSRFVFMPNLFSSIYVQPQGFVQSIPQKLVDTQGQLSFAMNGTSFIIFLFFYMIMSAIVYLLVSKLNTNRPLKNLFIRIWETRIKFSIIHDFIWLFGINILVQAFMQCRYATNGSDLALAIVWAAFVLALMFGLFGYGVKKYKQDPQLIKDNYSLLFEGTKAEVRHKFFIFIYYLRKILFAIILVSVVFNTEALAAAMLTLYSLVGLAVLIIRPYHQHLHNFVLLVNEGFLGFYCGGVIFFMQMIKNGEPSGAKITNGYILTIVATIHLCLLLIWGIYRSYFYLKQLHQQFKKSQFYTLYMDEQYDAVLQKQISQLNQQDKGQVQSIQITNVAANDKNGQNDQEEQVIRLKIKRRVKKDKFNLNKNNQNIEQQHKARQKQDYIKIGQQNQNYYKLKSNAKKYQRVVVNGNKNAIYNRDLSIQQSKQNQNGWVKMENNESKQQKNNNIIIQEIQHNEGYNQTKIDKMSNIFEQPTQQQLLQSTTQQVKGNIRQYEQIINVQNDIQYNAQQVKKQKQLELDRKMRETFKSSFVDFDQVKYFNNQDQENKNLMAANKAKEQQKQIEKEKEKQIIIPASLQDKKPKKLQQKFQDQSQIYSQQFENQNDNQNQYKHISQINNQDHLISQVPKNYNQYIRQPVIKRNTTIQNKNQQDLRQLASVHQSQQLIQQADQDKQQTSYNKKSEYKVISFDQLDMVEQNEQKKQKIEQKGQKQEKGNKAWSVEVQDLLQDKDKKNDDEQERKRKQKSKKMHLMLFEDDEED